MKSIKKRDIKHLFPLMAIILFMLTSCSNENEVADDSNVYEVNISAVLENIWVENQTRAVQKAPESTTPFYAFYVFDSNGNFIVSTGDEYTSILNVKSKIYIQNAGTYTIYTIINIPFGKLSSNPTSISEVLDISDNNDVIWGKTELTVSSNQLIYYNQIQVSHIKTRLTMKINNVHKDVTRMKVVLPDQSNKLQINGKLTGTDQSHTITLSKPATANTDGSYNWTSTETMVCPCATDATKMNITILWGDNTTEIESKTTSTVLCTSGKTLELSTNWAGYNIYSSSVDLIDWSNKETGTFNWR